MNHPRHRKPRKSPIQEIEERMRARKEKGLKSPYEIKKAQQIGRKLNT